MDTDGTQCQICLRTPDLKLGFFCPTCARNVFYEPRFQSVQTLLSKEALAKEVAEAVEAIDISSSHIGSNTDHDSVTRLAVEKARSETAQAEARAATILEDSESLRRQIEKMRQDVMRKRSELGQHSKFMKSLDRKLGQDRGTSMYPLQKEIVSTQSSWNRLHRHTAEARVFLCREVAALYGLQQHKKRKGLPGRDLYLIGGVPIIDLRDLNGKKALEICLLFHTHPNRCPSRTSHDLRFPSGAFIALGFTLSWTATARRNLFTHSSSTLLSHSYTALFLSKLSVCFRCAVSFF